MFLTKTDEIIGEAQDALYLHDLADSRTAQDYLPLGRDLQGINMHLQKAYNTNKASFKAKHWKADPTTGTYDVEAIRRARPEEITAAEWDKYIKFWNDPRTYARACVKTAKPTKERSHPRQGSGRWLAIE
ncbi:hypothetical protein Tco_0007527 [Tanacetum coccineum]